MSRYDSSLDICFAFVCLHACVFQTNKQNKQTNKQNKQNKHHSRHTGELKCTPRHIKQLCWFAWLFVCYFVCLLACLFVCWFVCCLFVVVLEVSRHITSSHVCLFCLLVFLFECLICRILFN